MEFLLSWKSAIFRDGLLLNFAIFRHLGAASRESGRTNLSRSRSNFPKYRFGRWRPRLPTHPEV